ncbi:type III pantothenate kinase [Lachnospiraceae bacterium OttesenSCG-928-E19]|nr:type III pantothenate kinase [Lachnospiraceae bacterium OttesenSCG-928-E19]
MLLALDVGNTNITIGVFDGEELLGTFRMTTKQVRTSDEYGISLCELVERKGISPREIDAAIVSSVVPDLMHSLGSAIIKYFGVKPLVVSSGVKTGIRIATDNPRQVGPDRIVDLVAAYELYGGPVLILDFGTATTYDLLEADGTFRYGVTSTGIRLSARALWGEAAMLPEIEIKRPKSILAKETVSSMQAGLVYGYIGQTEYIVKKMKEESGLTDAIVVATGGLGKIIVEGTDCIDIYNPKLTLQGLRFIYMKNKR